jgi:predicted ATPase
MSVFVGANGVGKTNRYEALALLRGAAETSARGIASQARGSSVA